MRSNISRDVSGSMPDVTVQSLIVRGSRGKGRRPYIQIDKVEYRGEQLALRFDLIGKAVSVHINHLDMRSCEVYTDSGVWMFTAYASGQFGLTPHTRDQRKKLSVSNETRVASRDALSAYRAHLLQIAAKASAGSPRKDRTRLTKRTSSVES